MKVMSETGAVPQNAQTASNLPELTVSELAGQVKRVVERDFDRVRVRGELGRVMLAKSGHLYVDLKDANACISMVMFRLDVQKLTFNPEEGLEVVAEGRLTTYPGRSQYQLIVDRLEPAGHGNIHSQVRDRAAGRAARRCILSTAGRRLRPLPASATARLAGVPPCYDPRPGGAS